MENFSKKNCKKLSFFRKNMPKSQKFHLHTKFLKSLSSAAHLRLSFDEKKSGQKPTTLLDLFHFLYFEPIFEDYRGVPRGGCLRIFFSSIDSLSNGTIVWQYVHYNLESFESQKSHFFRFWTFSHKFTQRYLENFR